MRQLRAPTDVRRRSYFEKVRMHAVDLSAARRGVRHDIERLRTDARLRYLHGWKCLRRERSTEPLRMHSDDVRGAKRELREHSRPMRRCSQLRRVHGSADLRR